MTYVFSLRDKKAGDVNGDGNVDISDIVAVINTIAGETSYKGTSDVNNDKKTDFALNSQLKD